MRKKLVALVVLSILLLSFIFTSCTLFTNNEERDYKQTLATVEHRGQVATITKGEFLEYYAQNYQIYMQYYGWDAQKCLDEFLKTLAKKEILLLEARWYFSNSNTESGSTIKIDANIMEFLGYDEQKWVIEQTNKTFQDAWDAELKDIIDSNNANNGTEDDETEEDEDYEALAPRPTMPKDEDTTFKPDTNITADMIPDKFFDILSKEEANHTDEEKEATKELNKILKKQYKDYDYFLNSQAESRLLTKFREAKQTFDISDEDVLKKYNLTLNQNLQKYGVDATYKSAVEANDGSVILYHNGQYVRVKSILLKFNEQQSAILKAVQEKYTSSEDIYKEIIESFRESLVTGESNSLVWPYPFDEDKYLGLKVNVSNLDYDENAVCKDKNCPCNACTNNPNYKEGGKCEIDYESGELLDGCSCVECENNAYERFNVPFNDILKEISEAIATAATTAEAEYSTKYPNGNDAGKQMYIAQAKLDEFEKWIFKVNDDEGMFEGKEYTETPNGKDSSYVKEYTALVRAMLEHNGNVGAIEVGVNSYTVGDKEYTIYNDVDGLSYIINDFGVHVVMISSIPVDKNMNAGKFTEKVDGENTFYTLHSDAYIQFDEETGKALTVLEVLKKSMEESAKSNSYSKYEQSFFEPYGDNFFSDANAKEKGIKLNKSVYNQIYSEITKK